ncbi:S1-like domain-containing RNA-binding protein [Blautia pseudococcoides]|uniref:CvfB family protein n=1 Tax=Blautia pseudococcoides TaxID=1796616 RepID=UPI00148B2013|nr:S1-like domain-containing RNA-binding protein [Blautia pseudococcoides]QJU16558.1 S1 RNA-binding domain-containing protein [Blautia pseudococcoides]
MELGKKQKLVVVKTVDFGVYLGDRQDAGEMDRVLLPGKEVPEGTKEGDQMEVFLYKDSSDRLIATTRTPELMMDQVGFLKVAQVTKIGAFLSWGLEKDLFLPYKEQTKKVHEGEEVLVSLYIDKSSRLCATMKVYHYLKTKSPYIVGDTVTGVVYEQSDNFGVFVAVDGQYSGLIPKQEAQGSYKVGEELTLRVTRVREDGKLNLSAKQKAHIQLHEDAQSVYEIIQDFEGVLPFDDKASPEIIQREFGLSKNAFKRAVGHLLKEEKIQLKNHKIYIR